MTTTTNERPTMDQRLARASATSDLTVSLDARKDVDDLQKQLKKMGAKIVDPAGKYYDNYYGVYFEDPNGLEFEGMWYGRMGKAA